MQACTIIARNYLAQARILARSFRRHHPDSAFAILVIDGEIESAASPEGCHLLSLADLKLAPGEIERMALIYDLTEFSTAVKPFLLRHLLAAEPEAVLYFDPDIEIFSSLADIAHLAQEHDIVLTPHVLQPMSRDGLLPSETTILAAGIYNLGFIAVGPGSGKFLEWWGERLRRESVIDPAKMRFTDQRWIDFVPALFPHCILRDPACNVAYWNLDQRALSSTGAGFEVNGEPLRFFHYSGYDPDHPEVLSKFQGEAPRVRLSEVPALAQICARYREQLLAGDYRENQSRAYAYDSLGKEFAIDRAMRAVYRHGLVEAETSGAAEPPNPFRDGGQAFLDWLNQPHKTEPVVITRYMLGWQETRADLQLRFPHPLGRDAEGLHEWFVNEGRFEETFPAKLIPSGVPAARTRALIARRLEGLRDAPSVLGQEIGFGALGDSDRYRLLGWSAPEREFTWSSRPGAQVALPVPKTPGAVALEVRLGAFTYPPEVETKTVEVFVRGKKIAEWNVGGEPDIFHVRIPSGLTRGGKLLVLEFRTPHPASPRKVLRHSDDPRILGVRVYHLRISRA